MTRKDLKKRLRILITARHYKYYSQDLDEIAAVMGTSAEKIAEMIDTPEWLICCSYWGNKPKLGDLNFAQRLWTELVENDEHIHLVAYPEKPIKALRESSEADTLLNSHLFCVDNLSDDEIRARLAEERKFEGEPVQYDGQHLPIHNYCWWLYPNYADGIYSKVLARVNMFGDLVVGSSEETCLVCIRHGRLSLTRQVCDDVANVHDKRLLVCL